MKIKGKWRNDGPNMAVEYLRQSRDGRITLVIDDTGIPKYPVLWAEMDFSDVNDARENLRDREGTTFPNIGFWRTGEKCPATIPGLTDWASSKKVDAVLWTALPPKFGGVNGRKPTLEEVICHLDNLEPTRKASAVKYIRSTPKQITTPYRGKLEEHLG